MEQKTKKREWVKTAAIIFLSVLLVLTFFSNTIMNRSLPEVAVQSVQPGTVNAKIRGTGSIAANETYDVTVNQTRKIQSVLVKVGDTVAAGDALFLLEEEDSEELAQAQQQLAALELAYQTRLISISNADATENRQLQKARQAYQEALDAYHQYSTVEPAQLRRSLATAEAEQKRLQRALTDAQEAVTAAQSNEAYLDAQSLISQLKDDISRLTGTIESYQEQLDSLIDGVNDGDGRGEAELRQEMNEVAAQMQAAAAGITQAKQDVQTAQSALNAAKTKLARDEVQYGDNYRALQKYAAGPDAIDEETLAIRMETYGNANNTGSKDLLKAAIARYNLTAAEPVDSENATLLTDLQTAYKMIGGDLREIATQENLIAENSAKIETLTAAQNEAVQQLADLQKQLEEAQKGSVSAQQQYTALAQKLTAAKSEYTSAQYMLTVQKQKLTEMDQQIAQLKQKAREAEEALSKQQDSVAVYQDALSAASTLEAAQETLEQMTFDASLGNAENLDLQRQKEEIDQQKALIEKLENGADPMEVTARVSGTISAINYTPGTTVGAEMPLASITVTDRGYTIQIAVTNEQAQRVKVGDTASVTNYYYADITATLEKIANDPKNPGKGKLLIFRLTGSDVEAGGSITLSIGQKSATYDALIPNSALRTDSNGTYVLVVTAKSTPLRTRYTATRVSVNVLAQDDVNAAVSGLVNGDFVITTSARPIESGSQIRMVEEG